MGGTTFYNDCDAKTASDAFYHLVRDAQYDYGHSGYTGTIAEKSGFVDATPWIPEDLRVQFATDINRHGGDVGDIQEYLKRIPRLGKIVDIYDDKWGPALCITIAGPNENGISRYVFCGWASS